MHVEAHLLHTEICMDRISDPKPQCRLDASNYTDRYPDLSTYYHELGPNCTRPLWQSDICLCCSQHCRYCYRSVYHNPAPEISCKPADEKAVQGSSDVRVWLWSHVSPPFDTYFGVMSCLNTDKSIRTVVFTAIRLYFVFNLDFTDISFSSIPLTIIGVIQLCVANMVASAPLLRPVLDRTVGRWFSLSIGNSSRETPRNNSTPANRLISGDSANTGLRKNLHNRSRLASGRGKDFERITESEENLRWELDLMQSGKGQSAYAASPDVNNNDIENANLVPAGKILKIQSTEISRE